MAIVSRVVTVRQVSYLPDFLADVVQDGLQLAVKDTVEPIEATVSVKGVAAHMRCRLDAGAGFTKPGGRERNLCRAHCFVTACPFWFDP